MSAHTNDIKPDLREARRLLDCGMHLVPLHAFEKRPMGDNWNAPSRRVKFIDPSATGYGLPLTLNKMCSIDPDNWPLAQRGMRALGFDLEALMAAGVRTKSTRPNSGGRSAFAEEPDLAWLTFRSKATGTVIEFRAFSPNLQDTIPGIVYTDNSGRLCTQTYANGKRLDEAPGLPDDLMAWWQRCSTDIDFLHEQERMFFAALGVAPTQSTGTGRNVCILAYPAPGHRGPFNAAGTVESILERHSYSRHGDRWAPPTATGAPSVRPIPGKDDLWQSDHASDPLRGTFDRWIAHVVLDHQGDLNAAIEQERQRQQAQVKDDFPTQNSTVIDNETGEIYTKPRLTSVSVSDVLTNPALPPEFVWEGYLPRGNTALLGAHGGTGKSTIALMLAVCTALGRPLFGVATEQSKVLFVSLEDGTSVVRHRLASICRAWSIDPEQLRARLLVVDGTEHPELFAAETRGAGELTQTYAELHALVKAEGFGLVVVDNASDAFGGDEIQRRQVRAFMRALAEVARLTNCAVMLLAHVDKNTSRNKKAEGGEGYSGSTAWHNSARSRLFLTRGDDGLLTLEHQKSNLGKKREPLSLVWLDGGLPMLATDAPNVSGFTERMQGRADDDRAAALLRLIAEFEGRAQYCSPAAQARNNVHALLRVEPAFQILKLSRDATARIVNQCQRAKWIEPLDYRSHDRKLRQRWTVTTAGREFVGLPAPTAPTAPTYEDGAEGANGACGAPTAPTYAGGVGDRARTHVGAEDGAEVEATAL